MNKTDKNSCSSGDILLGRQTNIGNMLEVLSAVGAGNCRAG